VLVPRQLGRQPGRVRVGADQHEQSVRGHSLLRSRSGLSQHEPLQATAPASVDDDRAGAHVDVGRGLDRTHEVVRHPGFERVGANE
jgi:hypothetical protein